MGIYINPTSGTKEEWLNKNYLLITDKPSLQINPEDILSIADFTNRKYTVKIQV